MEIDFTKQILEAKEKKTLNKPFRTPKGPKKFSVYVKNEKGNVVKVNFGDPNMEIKRDDPNRRKNFRARHNCDNPGPKTKARYWSCRQWRGGKKVEASEWDGETFVDHDELLILNPSLAFVTEEITEDEKDGCSGECGDCGCSDKESEAALTDKQKKLPPALQKAILKKKGKKADTEDKDAESEEDKEDKKDKEESPKKGLSEKQKKLPPALQKAILKKKSKADVEDHEGTMAEIQLKKIAKKAAILAMMMERMPEDINLMAWVQDKISKSEHMMDAAYDYMMNKYSNASDLHNKEQYASLWENIQKKRERIKRGSGEKMRKKGEKGAPTPEQMRKAK